MRKSSSLGRIVRLQAQNVKKIRAVDIKPDGSLVVIGGKNGAGKSSVLDSIEMALCGKVAQPPQPVRRGEEKAYIVCEFEDITVTRTIKPNGDGVLKVTNKEGARFDSPQTMLDKLVGGLSFDPLEFASRMKPPEQAATLRKLVGIDTTALDIERRTAFDQRTVVNRDGKALKAQLDAMAQHDGVPDEETPTSALVEELQAAQAKNAAHADQRKGVAEALGELGDAQADEQASKDRVAAARAALDEAEAELKAAGVAVLKATDEHVRRAEAAKSLKDIDTAPITERMNTLDETNRKVRENAKRADTHTKYTAKQAEWKALDDKVKACDAKKRKMIEDAEFPVEGLGFGEDGVEFNGFPFEQASLAEQLRVSVSMAIAMNPGLPVMLVHDGSLLDEDSFSMMSEMAEKAGAQVWLERVGNDKHVEILIEDGAIREDVKA